MRAPPSLRHLIVIAGMLAGDRVLAQTPERTPAWSFGASATLYNVPDDRDYVQPTLTADRAWLHLEARYNYEAIETASAWLGSNFRTGKKLSLEFTPEIGVVFGNTSGLAPGYAGTLTWGKLELYSTGEYLFDTGKFSNSFFYNWSELTVGPADWFRVGLVTQRTRAYQSARDIERGFLVSLSFKWAGLSGYVLNPDDEKPLYIVTLALTF